MTDAEYEQAINANAARAAISRTHGDEISGDYWWEQAQLLSDQREAARARALLTEVLKGSPDHSIVRNA